MGKFIQLAEDVFTRWKSCMAALAMQSDSELAEFLLNRVVSERPREMGQETSREGTVSPCVSDAGTPGPRTTSPAALQPQGVPSPPSDPTPCPPSTGHILHHSSDKPHPRPASHQSALSSDFGEYKHKLERRKRKQASEVTEMSVKVVKRADEASKGSDQRLPQTTSGNLAVPSGVVRAAGIPSAASEEETPEREAAVQQQHVIVTPQSLTSAPSAVRHGACGEEAMDLSVRPFKESFANGMKKDSVLACNPVAKDDAERLSDAPRQPIESTLRAEKGLGFTGVYDSSDLSDGSQHCVSPQPGFNSTKASPTDSGSDYDSLSGSPRSLLQQSGPGREEHDTAASSPRPGPNIGGIESIVQRLHQVKSETPSRSDSEDESEYYAVTFKDLIARTISRCDRYGKGQQRGKRKRGSKTSSELSAARKEEITAAKKLLERVSKNKRDRFKLTINCSTDGSEHVRNAAASEAIATLVRNVWHKENPKPIGQVIKEMVAKRLAGQEGEENDQRDNGQARRKGPMTIKDILNSRSDNVVDEYETSPKHGDNDEESLVVSDDGDKKEMDDDVDPTLSAAETLRKMAKNNEGRGSDENSCEPVVPSPGQGGEPKDRDAPFIERASEGIHEKDKPTKDKDNLDDDSDEDDHGHDHDQRKKAKRRSRKKKRRWAKMFAKGNKLDETSKTLSDSADVEGLNTAARETDNSEFSRSEKVESPTSRGEKPAHFVDVDENRSGQWPEGVRSTKGSISHSVVQSSGKTGMGSVRSLIENVQDEDEEVDVMETKEILPLRVHPADHPSGPSQRPSAEETSTSTSSKEPAKLSVISHSISQILEKGSSSSVESRIRSGSSSTCSTVSPVSQLPVAYVPPTSEPYPLPHRPLGPVVEDPQRRADYEGMEERVRMGVGEREEGPGEIKSISTATDFLIRFALMQNDGKRQGVVETQ